MNLRHNDDPAHQPLLKTDVVTLTLKGRQRGEQYHFEGGTTALPGIAFRSVMTPISEATAPPVISAGQGIANGLYSIHIRMLDGIDGGNTGVVLLRDGAMRGGDAYFDYQGTYASSEAANGRASLINHEHTPSEGATVAVRRLRGRHRLFRYLQRTGRGGYQRPRWSASAAFASARC